MFTADFLQSELFRWLMVYLLSGYVLMHVFIEYILIEDVGFPLKKERIILVSLMFSPFLVIVAAPFIRLFYNRKYDSEVYELQLRMIKDIVLWNKSSSKEIAEEIKELKRKRKLKE